MQWKLCEVDPPELNKVYIVQVNFTEDEIDWDTVTPMLGKFNGEFWVAADSSDMLHLYDKSYGQVLAYCDIPNTIQNTVRDPETYKNYLVYAKCNSWSYCRRMVGTFYKNVWCVGNFRGVYELYPDAIRSISVDEFPLFNENVYKSIGGIL